MSEKTSQIQIGNHRRPVIRRPTTSVKNNVSASQPVSISMKNSLTKISRTTSQSSIKSRSQTAKQQIKPSQSTLDDQECIDLRNNVMESGDLSQVSDQDLTKLHSHLREYVADCSMNEQYDEAQKAFALAERSKLEIQTRSKSALTSERSVGSTTQQKEDIEKDFQQKVQELNQKLDLKIQMLQEKHKQESEQFENTWIEDMPRRYRKPSQKLLELKEMERNLALANDFDGAKKIHAEAQQMADLETANAQRNLIRDYRHQKKQMEKRMARDFDNIENIRATQTTFLESLKAKRIDELLNRDKVLQQKRAEEQKQNESQGLQITPTFAGSRKRESVHKNLLGELKPPNDKSILEQERKENNERKRRQAEFQKKLNFQTKSRPPEKEEEEQYKNITSPSPKTFNEEVIAVSDQLENHDSQQPQQNEESSDQQREESQQDGLGLTGSLRQTIEDNIEQTTENEDGVVHKSQETQI